MSRMAASNQSLNNFLAKTADYGAQGAQSVASSAREAVAAIEADMQLKNALIQKQALIDTAKATGEANSAVNSANSNIGLTGDIISGIGGFLSPGFAKGGLFNKVG